MQICFARFYISRFPVTLSLSLSALSLEASVSM
jgi:hypothetical protein